VADAAAELLGALDEVAAAANDRVALLASEARFPGVAAARRELAGAQAALAGLLPALRRQLRQPQLEYKAVINQGEHMIELPVDFRGVPKARAAALRQALAIRARLRQGEVGVGIRAVSEARAAVT
jgi:hypothetical protein